jgi:transcriptional regulator with XRE-family HTH domain
MTSAPQIAPIPEPIGNIATVTDLPPLNPGKLLTGANIRAARKAQRFTKRRFAEELGVTEKTVYNWEHEVSEPEGENRIKVLELLGLEDPRIVGTGRVLSLDSGTDQVAAIKNQIASLRAALETLAWQVDQLER